MSNLLFIDLREEQEILDVKLESNNPNTTIINIPTRNIFPNVEYFDNVSKTYDTVYLLCKSGTRSNNIKQTYFKNNPKVQSYKGGWKNLLNNDSTDIKVVHSDSILNMAPQQYMQIVIVLFLLSVVYMNYQNIDKQYVNVYVLSMAIFILYQVLTKSCLMTSCIPLP